MSDVLYHLRRAALFHDSGLTDGELLEQFLVRREEAAFDALVRRSRTPTATPRCPICSSFKRRNEGAAAAARTSLSPLAFHAATPVRGARFVVQSGQEGIMIELTEAQRQELSAPEPVAIDPATKEAYVLVRKDI